MIKYLIDAGAGFGLVFFLLIVFVADFFLTRSRDPRGQTSANTLKNVKVFPVGEKGVAKRLKLGVTPTAETDNAFNKKDKWDDMGKLLDELGEGYRHEILHIRDLVSGTKNHEYDVIFLTCSDKREEDVLREPLIKYVSEGGILYASDWRYEAVANAFPDVVEKRLAVSGAKQEIEADIIDPDLEEALKRKKISLKFDLPDWKTAGFGGPRVKTLIRGKFVKEGTRGDGKPDFATAPLMVKFQVGKGTVFFTSFHNEKQNSEVEKKLLQYLVFSLVTAGIDTDVSSRLGQSGFSSQRSSLLSTPKKNEPVVRTYDNKSKSDLRFALGFRNEGAKLRFNIKAPDGTEWTEECAATTIIEVAGAMPGTWTYTVTDLHLPYENFPFTVTVGEKK